MSCVKVASSEVFIPNRDALGRGSSDEKYDAKRGDDAIDPTLMRCESVEADKGLRPVYPKRRELELAPTGDPRKPKI